MIEIKRATSEDLDFIISELIKFDEFYREKYSFLGGPAYIFMTISNLVREHVAFIASRDGESLGFIVGHVHPHFYNPSLKVLDELWWWVRPCARHTKAASLLLDEFTLWGRRNVDVIAMHVSPKTGVKISNLERYGFKLSEYTLTLEI